MMFFFSSRRRHTRSYGDWSSDVCSSDLEKPTGLAIVNLRTREMSIAGQTPSGSGFWHVHGSVDGRWVVGDDFSRSVRSEERRVGKEVREGCWGVSREMIYAPCR